jgi:iron complex transport system ATP-binding protein
MSAMLNAPGATVKELACEGVSFSYGERPAVGAVSLRLAAGERVAIVGPNGCGTSTLLKLLVGGLPPRAGKVTIDGRWTQELGRPAMARRIAMVPQMAGGGGGLGAGGGLGGGFLVREIVLMARHAAHADPAAGFFSRIGALGFETPADLQLANEAMWAMDVHHLAQREADALSGGERQRVAIARALAQQAPVLLLDEPTSALDLYHQLELLALLEDLSRAGRLIVLVTHDLNLAARWASRVVVMDRGEIAADGPASAVLTAAVLEGVYRVKVIESADGLLRFERA